MSNTNWISVKDRLPKGEPIWVCAYGLPRESPGLRTAFLAGAGWQAHEKRGEG